MAKFTNENRTRYYGLRIGDIIDAKTPNGTNWGRSEVLDWGSNNNEVIIRNKIGQPIEWVAEWCDIVTKVEDQNKHTPEPWEVCKNLYQVNSTDRIHGMTEYSITTAWIHSQSKGKAPIVTQSISEDFNRKPQTKIYIRPEDAERIVACVNAMKGIADPAFFMEMVERLNINNVELMKERDIARGQRDTAWKELNDIRAFIGADENEATSDEVVRLMDKK
jgi:hypothetical protein